MANVLNRTTKQYLPSVNEPDYPQVDWIWNPNLGAVTGFASKYWTITGDVVTLMNQGARDAVDAAELAAKRDATVARLDAVEEILRAIMQTLMTETNLHASAIATLKDAIVNAGNTTLASVKTAAAATVATPQRTLANLRTGIRNNLGS
jgi:hypothetical protein